MTTEVQPQLSDSAVPTAGEAAVTLISEVPT